MTHATSTDLDHHHTRGMLPDSMPLTASVYPVDLLKLREKRRPRSDSANALSDLGLRCSHMSKSSFSLCSGSIFDSENLATAVPPSRLVEENAFLPTNSEATGYFKHAHNQGRVVSL